LFSVSKFILYIRSFLCLSKETNPKKDNRSLAVSLLAFGYLALLAKNGRLGKSLALRRVVFPYFAVLLSCVKWCYQNKKSVI